MTCIFCGLWSHFPSHTFLHVQYFAICDKYMYTSLFDQLHEHACTCAYVVMLFTLISFCLAFSREHTIRLENACVLKGILQVGIASDKAINKLVITGILSSISVLTCLVQTHIVQTTLKGDFEKLLMLTGPSLFKKKRHLYILG